MLGDGYIYKGKKYLEWQYEQLKEFYSSNVGEHNSFDKRTNKTYYGCFLNPRSGTIFSLLRKNAIDIIKNCFSRSKIDAFNHCCVVL